MKRGEASSAWGLSTPAATVSTGSTGSTSGDTSLIPMWTSSTQRKMIRLYLYTTLSAPKIIEVLFAENPEPAPGRESVYKKLNELLDKEPRWMHPRTESDMFSRLHELFLSPTRSPLPDLQVPSDVHTPPRQDSTPLATGDFVTSPTTPDTQLFHHLFSSDPTRDYATPISGPSPVHISMNQDTSSTLDFLPQKTTSVSSFNIQGSTTDLLPSVLHGYSEPYIKIVKRLIRRHSVSLDDSAKKPFQITHQALPHTAWLNDEDAPPSHPKGPPFLPGDFLNLDLLLQHQPPCFSGGEQHANRSCLCFVRNDFGTSKFVTIEGVTLYGQRLLQNGLMESEPIIFDEFGNSILHFLAARGLFDHLLRAVISNGYGSLLNARNTAGQTFLHTLDRSYFSHTKLLLELIYALPAKDFNIYARDHYGRTFFHLLLADDVAHDTLSRVTTHYGEGFSNHVKRDAFNLIPTLHSKPTIGTLRPNVEEMDLDSPLSDSRGFYTSETYNTSRMIQKEADLVAFIRLAFENPTAENSDGSNGLHCLASATLSSSSMLRKFGLDTSAGLPLRAKRMRQKPNDLDSSTDRMTLRLEILNNLLHAGVDPNHYNCSGNTPLMAFVALLPEDDDYKIGPEILTKLIKSGANFEARNRRGETALHIAVRCGRKLAARSLVQNGANVHTRDAAGRSLLEVIDVKMRCIPEQNVETYAQFEACRAWLSGKAEAVQSPTVIQEWAINPITESKATTDLLALTQVTPVRHPSSTTSRNISKESYGMKEFSESNEAFYFQSSLPATSLMDGNAAFTSGHLVSEPSMLPTTQLSEVTQEFSRAISLAIRPGEVYDSADYWSRKHVLPLIQVALKTFSKSVKTDKSVAQQVKGAESIRHLRSRIAQRVHCRILSQDQELENRNRSTDLATSEESIPWDMLSSSSDHSTDSGTDGSTIKTIQQEGEYIIPTTTLQHFTEQPVFNDLVHTIEQLFQRYHSPKMLLIRRVTSSNLRRRFTKQAYDGEQLCAMFNINWDLREFLCTNYETGVHQKLKDIIAITGGTNDAQLCSVGQYLETGWETHHNDLLLAIERALVGEGLSDMGTQERQGVTFHTSMRTASVRGSEEFIVSIAQQVSWLAAVCQEKSNQATYAYVGFEESVPESSGLPSFDIDVTQEAVPFEPDQDGCWTNLMGNAVLVQGFPISDRKHDEKGLEADIQVMAAISGTPRAVTFGGGFIFKGRCHALVPIERLSSAIQWHVIDTYPRKLEWEDIDKACPTRLRGTSSNDNLWNARSFFGWCPQVLELLGTERFQYSSVRYSEARTPSNRAQVDKFVFGFSQWVTLTADISIGRNDGVLNQRADDYETLLNDARSIHVILHDTVNKRATQTNAEDLILHLILHRRKAINPAREGAEISDMGEVLESVHPDRRKRSTRQVMLSNAERIISLRKQLSSSEPEIRRFKNEVKLIYSMIDGLWAHNHATGMGPKPLKLSFDLGQNVHGWEYMDVLEDSKWMPPKSINLQRSSGQWHQYAKEIRALVLFGANFGDVLLPALPEAICSDFASLPRDACYLAVRVDSLQYLFHRQGSLEDQKKLTDSGLTIQGHKDLFKPCTIGGHSLCIKPCDSNHLVRLVGQSSLPRNHCPIILERDGAVIVGQTKGASFLWSRQGREILQAAIISSSG